MPSRIVVVSPNLFTAHELEQYEQRILDSRNITEREAARFFNEFPKFLTVGGYKNVAREVVLYRGNGEPMYRVDFCRRRFGNEYWDIVELKSPKVPFVIRIGNHWRFSEYIERGIHQARDYADLMDNDIHRLETEKRTGIKVFRPRILLIGGRKDADVDAFEVRRLISRYNNIDIQSYEDIYEFAKDNYKTNVIAVPVIQSWDIPWSDYGFGGVSDVPPQVLDRGLAEEWLEYVEREKRLNKLGPFLLKVLAPYVHDHLVLDAAAGVGCECTFLLEHGFRVIANEIDTRFAHVAKQYFYQHGITDYRMRMVDWRELGKFYGSSCFGAVLVLGNSLTLLLDHDSRMQALHEFYHVLKLGGILVIDERDYTSILNNAGEIKSNPMQEYPFRKGELQNMLYQCNFKGINAYYDLQEQRTEDAKFITYVAKK